MTWEESEHPREENGRFTFKNEGSSKSSPAEILYGAVSKLEKEKKDIKNKLLNILGNKATPTDILYGDEKSLTEKIKKEGLGNKSEKTINKSGDFFKRNLAEIGIANAYKSLGYNYAKHNYGEDTVGMLDLAHKEKMNPAYAKDAIVLNNFNDDRIKNDKKYLANKLFSQFNNEYTKNINIEKIKGYFFKNNSEPSQRIANDSDFIKKIQENKKKVLAGKDISIEFPRYSDNKKSNLHFAFGHVDIRNGYLDKQGNLRIKVYDTYDFNKENKTPLNQAGRNKMLSGDLIPFFTIHDIIIPKNVVDKL